MAKKIIIVIVVLFVLGVVIFLLVNYFSDVEHTPKQPRCATASDCGTLQKCGTTWECNLGECKQFSKECFPPEKIYNSPFGISGVLTGSFPPISDPNASQNIKDLGIQSIRTGHPLAWARVDPEMDGTYNFAVFDGQYSTLNSLGLRIMVTLSHSRNKDSSRPVDYAKWADFVKASVQRYDYVKLWQIGNEPNIKINWNGTPEEYAEFTQKTYVAIKETCHDCSVVMAGMYDGGEWKGFYGKVLEKLRGKYIDIVDIHSYGNAQGDYRKISEIYREYDELLEKNGFNNIEVILSETNTWTGDPKEPQFGFQSEKAQAIDLVKRFVTAFGEGIKQVHWFRTEEFYPERIGPYSPFGGLIYDGENGEHEQKDLGDGRKKLSFYTYKFLVEKLTGFSNIETISASSQAYVYKFTKNGKPIWIVWSDNSPRDITITGINSSSVTITEAVPKYETGKEVTEYATAFKEETKKVEGNAITIMLGDSPVYIENR